jgi:hypothetical protein
VVLRPRKNKRRGGEKIDDASITAQVKMRLFCNRPTGALNTSVTKKKGVVTLGGKAKNTTKRTCHRTCHDLFYSYPTGCCHHREYGLFRGEECCSDLVDPCRIR